MCQSAQDLLQQYLCRPCQNRGCTVPLESINQYAVTDGYLALQRLCLSRAYTLVLIRVIRLVSQLLPCSATCSTSWPVHEQRYFCELLMRCMTILTPGWPIAKQYMWLAGGTTTNVSHPSLLHHSHIGSQISESVHTRRCMHMHQAPFQITL